MSALESTTNLRPEESETHFGKYRLVKKLASGGMAQIYLAAIDGPDGFTKSCVIKKVLPEYVDRGDFSEMFVTEAKVAALLNHPNIIQIFDFGKLDDKYYLAMEYINGPSLEAMMLRAARAGKALGPKLAVHLGIPLCDALTYLEHQVMPDGTPLNLVHRDVTPGNVLISKTAEVKLTDFGVVKTASSPSSTQAGVVKGKFAYMSPEQALGKVLDHRSDIFSLAVVLYEVATGRRLWKRGPPLQMIASVVKAEIPRPSQVVPGFPLPLEKILMKALAKDPKDRYPSARDMLADLDAFRQSQQWSGGRRELSLCLATYFPETQGSNIYALPSPSVSAIPEMVAHPLGLRAPLTPIEEDGFLPLEDEILLDDLGEEEDEEGAVFVLTPAQRDLLLTCLGALLLSAFFWFFVLS
jgi:eukaryotic-like serine/threonine-protein kinase